jgi:hypothetical protein
MNSISLQKLSTPAENQILALLVVNWQDLIWSYMSLHRFQIYSTLSEFSAFYMRKFSVLWGCIWYQQCHWWHWVLSIFSAKLNVQIGSRRGSTWPRGYTSCWQVYTNKTRVMPFIPTKSVACMSTSWLLATFIWLSHTRAKSEILML